MGTSFAMSNWERYTPFMGLALVMWRSEYPNAAPSRLFLSPRDNWRGLYPEAVHQMFEAGQNTGKGFIALLEFLAISSAIAFLFLAVMSDASPRCWTAISGYSVLGFAVCRCLHFCCATSPPGSTITGHVFDCALWLL